jgi:hypothetical protein
MVCIWSADDCKRCWIQQLMRRNVSWLQSFCAFWGGKEFAKLVLFSGRMYNTEEWSVWNGELSKAYLCYGVIHHQISVVAFRTPSLLDWWTMQVSTGYQGAYKVLCSTCTLVAYSVLMSLEYSGNCNFSSSCSSIMFTRENVFHWNCTNCLLLVHGWRVGDTYIICAQRVILSGNALWIIFSSLVYGRWQRDFCRSLDLTMCWTFQLLRSAVLSINIGSRILQFCILGSPIFSLQLPMPYVLFAICTPI